MDATQVPPANLAESYGALNEQQPALPWVVWHGTCGFLHQRMHMLGKSRRDRIRLLSGTFFMAMALLVASGCAAAQNAVSPAPTLTQGGGAFIATLTPEGTNTYGSGVARLQLNP